MTKGCKDTDGTQHDFLSKQQQQKQLQSLYQAIYLHLSHVLEYLMQSDLAR